MVRLVRGAIYFLCLSRSRDGKTRQLDCFRRFDRVLKGWAIGTRLSPVFGLTSSSPPDLSGLKRSWVFFCGPVYPGDLDAFSLPHTFISYGLFNVVLFCISHEHRKAARSLARAKSLFWEEWSLSRKTVNKITCGGPKGHVPSIPRSMLKPLDDFPPNLETNGREYVTQIASAFARAAFYLPAHARELIRFDSICRRFLKKSFSNTIMQDILVNTNAALALYVSQTYSGTTPIFETKTRLWNHSLLGIGTASMALLNLRSFIERAISDAKIIKRIKALKNERPARFNLIELPPADIFWKKDHLKRDEAELGTQDDGHDEDPILPLLTFFSGRDGYRTTHFTLSAPLELIGSCNTLTWTLLTFTHEISHTIISGVLGELLAGPSEPKDRFIPAVRSASSEKGGNNLFEQVRSLLCMGVWRMSCPEGAKEEINESRLREYVRQNWHELQEILASCFDFQYFYRATPERYMRSLWVTWEAIPNIEDRIPEYITRCLCALHTNNVRRDNGRNTSLGDFIDLLSKTTKEFPKLKYANSALNEVKQKKGRYLKLLKDRELLVKFARHFLHSPQVEKIVMPESRIPRDALKPMYFPRERIHSPLRFIEEVCQDSNPNMLRSVGIFQRLAFLELR